RALQAKERRAQREQALARDAQAAIENSIEKALKKRSKDLDKAERESYENAARIAKERAEAAARRAQQNEQNSNHDSDDAEESTADEPPTGNSGGSASPVPGAVIGAYFGQTGLWARYHTGLDFRAGSGTPIKAVKSG